LDAASLQDWLVDTGLPQLPGFNMIQISEVKLPDVTYEVEI